MNSCLILEIPRSQLINNGNCFVLRFPFEFEIRNYKIVSVRIHYDVTPKFSFMSQDYEGQQRVMYLNSSLFSLLIKD